MDKEKLKWEPTCSLEALFRHLENRKWYEKLYDRIYGIIYRLPQNTRHLLRSIKSYFIRGKRGWAPMDTWSLDAYLAEVIRDSVTHLRNTACGHPSDLSSMDEWHEILDKIAWSFDFAVKVIDCDIHYFEKDGFESEERYEEVKESVSRACRGHVATEEEIAKYKEGFELFQKYFMALWS